MFKKISIFILSALLLVPMNTVYAMDIQDKSQNIDSSSSVEHWKEKFPSFKNSLENGYIKNLVSSSEQYIKFTTKDKNTDIRSAKKEDIISIAYDKNSYELEKARELLNAKVETVSTHSTESYNAVRNQSWLRMDIQAYSTSIYDEYQAVQFWQWLDIPVFRFTDLGAMSVSNGMTIGPDRPTNFAHAEFSYREINSDQIYYSNPKTSISNENKSIYAKYDLPASSNSNFYVEFSGMLSANVKLNGSSSGNVACRYEHAVVPTGISFDKGYPSLIIGSSDETVTSSVFISK